MKKMNKKGFTIVELVIVIAVIAILSAVMIPTFSGIVKKSKASAALREANSALTVVLAEEDGQLKTEDESGTYTYYFINNGYWFKINEQGILATIDAPAATEADAKDLIYTKSDIAPITLADGVTNIKKTVKDLGKTVVWVDFVAAPAEGD